LIDSKTAKVSLSNPNNNYNNPVINLVVGPSVFSFASTAPIYSQQTYTQVVTGSLRIVENVLVSVAIVVAMALYILGNKHNHIMYYIQKICFLGFALQNQSLEMLAFLTNLNFSYFEFGSNALTNSLSSSYI
jgi:hypothetical protein